jgi:hypothetical protein
MSLRLVQHQSQRGPPEGNMIMPITFVLLASTINLPSVQSTTTSNSSSTHPVFVDVPRNPDGLSLYNEKGEVVAKCLKKDESFHDCKMEFGVTLDDLMNAWVHAYLEVQK